MRQDLHALTPEALAALANWGLVKRAQKEIEAGQGPQLVAQEGAVLAQFPDGVTCRLPDALPWTGAICSCGATMCRHRIALVLSLCGGLRPDAAQPPLQLELDQLEHSLGARLMERARRLRSQGLQGQLTGPPWQVRLPVNTVRFLSGNDLHYARCDCQLPWPCEHIALAAWVVEALGGVAGRLDWTRARDEVHLDLQEVWQEGCLGNLPKAPAGCTWIQLLLEEMAELQQAYREGSAHYDSLRWLFCALSLWCRSRASGQDISSEYRLGRELPLEQELEQTRLVSLGATRGPRGTDLYLADPAGVVLRLNLPVGKSLPAGLRLAELAHGQLVSRGVVRRANGTVRLRRERQRHSLLPLGNAWDNLARSLLWPGWEGWRERESGQVTRLLRPPLVSEDFVVLEVAEVSPMIYLPGPQKLVAQITDIHGGSLTVERSHRAEAPAALDVLVKHLPAAQRISGWVDCSSGQPVLDPVALWSDDGLVIPDLDEAPSDWDLPWLVEPDSESPLHQLYREALGLCAETLHLGRSRLLPSFDGRRLELAHRLQEAGLARLSKLLGGSWGEADFWTCALHVYLGRENLADVWQTL